MHEPKTSSPPSVSLGKRIFEIRPQEAEALREYAVKALVRQAPHIAAFAVEMVRKLRKR